MGEQKNDFLMKKFGLTESELFHELGNCEMAIYLLTELIGIGKLDLEKLESKKKKLEEFKVSLMNLQAMNELFELHLRLERLETLPRN